MYKGIKRPFAKGVIVLFCVSLLTGCGKKEIVSDENDAMPSRVLIMDDAGFNSQIAQGVILVDFWAPWCGDCKIQEPIVEAVANQLHTQAIVARLNVATARDVASELNIQSIPALIIFKNGKPLRKFSGVTDAATLVSAVNSALSAQ